jgi:8-oxo-dGTP pyrophosphatase MutT (NUDIX family)
VSAGPVITRLRRITARCEPFTWRWAEANRAAIAGHWAARTTAQPSLFNGPVLLVAELSITVETLRATFFRTDYASLLAFKDFGFPDPSVANGFAMAALEARDGAFVLGVMGPHTANRGRIYFPAGTPDPADLRPDGTVDLAGSVIRELHEETGLTPDDYAVADEWIAVRDGASLALMRPVRLKDTADAVRTRIRDRLSREAQPELADICIVRTPGDLDDTAMPRFLQAYLRWSFAERLATAGQRPP